MATYLALTSHQISQDKSTGHVTLKSALITFHHIKKKHTGVNMADTILELLDQANVLLRYAFLMLFICSQVSHFLRSATLH